MIIKFDDNGVEIRLNLINKEERFTDPEVFHCRSITGELPLRYLEVFLSYLRKDEVEIFKKVAEKFLEVLKNYKEEVK